MVSREEYTRKKAAGGWEYQEMLLDLADQKREWRARGNDRGRSNKKGNTAASRRARLLMNARRRARETGLPATIRTSDLHWPTHCPILGIRLDYDTPRGQRKAHNPANPSLDRWDNADGYVPGNVVVVSLRANQIKNNATWQELLAVANYARDGLAGV